MEYVLYFNLAAIITCMILLVIMNAEHRKVSTIRSRILGILLALTIVLAVSGMVSWNMVDYVSDIEQYNGIRTFAVYINLISHTGLCLTIFFYNYFLVRPYDKADGKTDLIYFFPFIAVLIILMGNPVSNWIFYLDEAGGYHRGSLMWLLYIADIYYAYAVLISILFRHRKEIGRHKLIPSYAYVIVFAAGFVLQYFACSLQFESFAVAIGAVILVMNVQNPREIIDVETSLLNYGCFKEEIYKNLNHQRKFRLVYIYFGELEDYRVIYENKIYDNLVKQAGKRLKGIRRHMLAYRIKSDVFVIIYPGSAEKYMESDRMGIYNAFKEEVQAFDKRLGMYPSVLELEYPKDVENLEDIMEAARILQDKFKYYKGGLITSQQAEFSRQREKKQLEKIISKLAKDRFIKVSCTPIFRTADDKVEAAYVGIFLKDYMDEEMTYGEFLKKCGNNEQVVTIERQLFDIICSMLAENNKALAGARKIGISLSNVHFMQDDMVEVILRTMRRYDISNEAISFGVSNEVLNNMNYTIKANIDKLKLRGIDIFLEEYGVGKANFDNLTSMNVGYIEMDESISASIYADEKYETVMKRQIEVAHKLGTKMLVCGIVDKSQVRKLRELNADYYKLKSIS